MNIPDKDNNIGSTKDKSPDSSNESKEQKMAVNPNPRANENVKQAPFDKTAKSDEDTFGVGTEITDGEGG